MYYLIIYFVFINMITFLLMLADKRRAIAGRWRISEKTLLGAALIGGSCGGLAGMFLFHHKTKHLTFRLLLPLFFLIHLIAVFFLCRGGII